ncbi:MAG: phosphoesterase RecJ-like protein [Myxococcota bacterium]
MPGYRFDFMPGADTILDDNDVRPVYDAVVVLDGDRHRLSPPVAAAFSAATVRGIVDHHSSTKLDGYTHAWVEAKATSTCEMLYAAWLACDVPLDPILAELLYVGAIFDTGGFRYSNTTPNTHLMAAALLKQGIDHAGLNARVLMSRRETALRVAGEIMRNATLHLGDQLLIGDVSNDLAQKFGVVSGDTEGVVDSLVYVHGVEVSALLNERDCGEVKISLRSKGAVNVAHVAQALSPAGGGHAKAAGVCLKTDLASAKRAVIEQVSQVLTRLQPAAAK